MIVWGTFRITKKLGKFGKRCLRITWKSCHHLTIPSQFWELSTNDTGSLIYQVSLQFQFLCLQTWPALYSLSHSFPIGEEHWNFFVCHLGVVLQMTTSGVPLVVGTPKYIGVETAKLPTLQPLWMPLHIREVIHSEISVDYRFSPWMLIYVLVWETCSLVVCLTIPVFFEDMPDVSVFDWVAIFQAALILIRWIWCALKMVAGLTTMCVDWTAAHSSSDSLTDKLFFVPKWLFWLSLCCCMFLDI